MSIDLNAARALVAERLGHEWQLTEVHTELTAGHHVGDPTGLKVHVRLDFNMEGRESRDNPAGWTVGPHLVYTGEGGSLEEALAVAFGAADVDEERREQSR